MPSVSDKQKHFMMVAAHNKDFAKKNKISQKVAKEFVKKDANKAAVAATKENKHAHGVHAKHHKK